VLRAPAARAHAAVPEPDLALRCEQHAATHTRHPEARPRPLEPGASKGDGTDLGFTRDRHIKVPKSAIADLGGRSSFEGLTSFGHLRMTVVGRFLLSLPPRSHRTNGPCAFFHASMPPWMWHAVAMPASCAACTAMAERSPKAQ